MEAFNHYIRDLGISVIITTYNSEKFIDRCLNSVLNQKFPSLEVIVVDGNSKDSTIDKVKKYESSSYVKCFVIDGHVHVARNKGIEVAKNDIIIFLDPDDELIEGSLQFISRKFEELGNKYGVVYAYSIDDDGNLQGFRLDEEGPINFNDFICEKIRYGNCFAAFKREAIKPFKFEAPGYEFMLHKRVMHNYGGYFIPIPLLRYHNRSNPSSLSKHVSKIGFKKRYGSQIALALSRYLVEFKGYFINNCPETYARLCLHTGILFMFNGLKVDALRMFVEALKYGVTIRALFYCLLVLFVPTNFLVRFYESKEKSKSIK
jgi:glycosyltransferase involved in cell wall biosynthesis